LDIGAVVVEVTLFGELLEAVSRSLQGLVLYPPEALNITLIIAAELEAEDGSPLVEEVVHLVEVDIGLEPLEEQVGFLIVAFQRGHSNRCLEQPFEVQ
jgi:hypothetical protein